MLICNWKEANPSVLLSWWRSRASLASCYFSHVWTSRKKKLNILQRGWERLESLLFIWSIHAGCVSRDLNPKKEWITRPKRTRLNDRIYAAEPFGSWISLCGPKRCYPLQPRIYFSKTPREVRGRCNVESLSILPRTREYSSVASPLFEKAHEVRLSFFFGDQDGDGGDLSIPSSSVTELPVDISLFLTPRVDAPKSPLPRSYGVAFYGFGLSASGTIGR